MIGDQQSLSQVAQLGKNSHAFCYQLSNGKVDQCSHKNLKLTLFYVAGGELATLQKPMKPQVQVMV